MKLIDNRLYIEFREMVECGVSDGYLRKAKSEGAKCWTFIDDPADRRRVLIDYDNLTDANKKKVTDRFGNPYDMVARQPILEMVVTDHNAEEYYRTYQFDGNNFLPISRVRQYTRAASWLGMINTVQADKSIIKKSLGLSSIPDFFIHVNYLVSLEKDRGKNETYLGVDQLPGSFPSTYQRLMERAKKYQSEGYDCLVDSRYGNKNAAKIGKKDGGFDPELEQKQLAVIRAVAAKHNNLDADQVAQMAQLIFSKNGWEMVSRRRIHQILAEQQAVLTPGRRGRRAYNSSIAMQAKRKAPELPLRYFTLDGWTVELAYQDKGSYTNRLVMVVVLDACGKYPVGYAIGDRENAELIRQANRNALLHIRELFGNIYRPFQVQSDRYAIKQLTPFYAAVGQLHTPAAVGNAKAKIIEPYFNYLNSTYCQLMPNWTGHNVTARRENQVNAEFLDMIKHNLPDRAGVIKQINAFMKEERRRKVDEYLSRWAQVPDAEKREMNRMDWLMVFGQELGRTNSITGQGITKTIAGQSFTFDSFDPLFRQSLHIDWTIIADTDDLQSVLAISPDGKQKFVLEQKRVLPMDIYSTTDDDREELKRIREFNKSRQQEIIDLYASDAEIVQEVITNTPLALDDHQEAALKLMLTYGGQQKEALQNAKGLKQVQKKEQRLIDQETKWSDNQWSSLQQEYLSGKTDFNEYLD